MKKESGFKLKLGMFVTIGLVLFIVVIYLVASKKFIWIQHSVKGSI
jgi:hypothetical protein